jgi:hypothetical protein
MQPVSAYAKPPLAREWQREREGVSAFGPAGTTGTEAVATAA